MSNNAKKSQQKSSVLPERRSRVSILFWPALAGAWIALALGSYQRSLPILGFGFVVALVGIWVGRRRSLVTRGLVALPGLFAAWAVAQNQLRFQAPKTDAEIVQSLVAAEETMLKLNPKLELVSKGLFHLQLPAPVSESVFGSSFTANDLGPAPTETPVATVSLETHPWPVVAGGRSMAHPSVWRSLLDGIGSIEHSRFTFLEGDHPDGDMYRFDSRVAFEALAQMKSSEWRAFHGTVNLSWERSKATANSPVGDWKIIRWATEEMEYVASPRRLFVEALESSIRPPQDAAKLRRSLHQEAAVKFYRSGMKQPPHPYFAPISANQKEGIAVADIDGDGFDDIYITVRLGTNLFLHNNGDGTFTEEGAARGLALPGHTTCAIFADFDNDGDLDLMLGRSLLRTAYLENRGGLFFQRPSPKHFPMAVISMAAADYNGDGLLDVYLCTYRPAATAGSSPSGGVAQIEEGGFDWPDEFLAPELAKEYRRRILDQKQHKPLDNQFPDLFDQIGPPNVLLVNKGKGWFEVAPENPVVGVWRNSLQATWCDFDQDGDPDLYIANDWALDNLFRNDGAAGFTEVSVAQGMTYYGFAMGASWGDYDNDGLEDLYVSNMYSAAGRRITARIPGMNKTFAESAAGNWLYHQERGGGFKQVAGLKAPALTVMNAGWSWGGCFTDFDNDGFLDLYVLSGYFTAPEELASDLELESNLWRTTVRSDEKLARPSMRFSPEWKRTPAPDSAGPQIDARLGGVDRQGDRVLVHSLNGHERNHFFANQGGKAFADISGLSGLDNPADSRGFAVLDYDRDGFEDIAMVNANTPLFNLYHNEMPAAGARGGMIALRFVGGNRTSAPSKDYSNRDGYGARVVVDLGDTRLIREHRCGDGWSVQNSATMIIGIGSHASVPVLTVRWPSGKTTAVREVKEGALVTVYENPGESPGASGFSSATYRVRSPQTNAVQLRNGRPN